MRIILASHSKLAEGMKQTAEFFGLNGISTIEQTMDDTHFENRAKELLDFFKNEKDIIVFTDIVGGSVNQVFTRLLKDYQFHLISGMNLSLILELGYKNVIDEETIIKSINGAKEEIVYMNNLFKTIQDDEREDD